MSAKTNVDRIAYLLAKSGQAARIDGRRGCRKIPRLLRLMAYKSVLLKRIDREAAV